jgi:hypothetical protein
VAALLNINVRYEKTCQGELEEWILFKKTYQTGFTGSSG